MDKVVWRKDKIGFLGTWLDRWRIIRLNFWYMSKGVWRNNTIDFRGTWLHGWRNDKPDLEKTNSMLLVWNSIFDSEWT